VNLNTLKQEIKPSDFIQSSLRLWWVLFLCMVLGGLIGLGLASIREPLYETASKILIAVDRSRTSIRDDFTIYQADDRVRALMLADTTLESALDQIQNHDEILFKSAADMREAIRITQHPASYSLYVYSHDPVWAAKAADAWAQASLEALEEASLYAIRAAELQSTLFESHCTLSLHWVGEEERVVWVCTSHELGDQAEELPEQLLEAAMKSRGILPFYSFSMGQKAVVPTEPILWNRTWFIIAGIIAGTLLGSIISYLLSMREESSSSGEAGR
jgi:uncharacterized protein involved in exopolysaccharide biosynthesis